MFIQDMELRLISKVLCIINSKLEIHSITTIMEICIQEGISFRAVLKYQLVLERLLPLLSVIQLIS